MLPRAYNLSEYKGTVSQAAYLKAHFSFAAECFHPHPLPAEWRAAAERQVSLLGLCAFAAYLGANLIGLSGIAAIFAAGTVLSHYGWHSLSTAAKVGV